MDPTKRRTSRDAWFLDLGCPYTGPKQHSGYVKRLLRKSARARLKQELTQEPQEPDVHPCEFCDYEGEE